MLASKYTANGLYEKAQEMLDSLPDSSAEMDKRQLQANLWIKQGKLTEAAEILERKLYIMGITELPIILMSLADISLREDSEEDAGHLTDIASQTAKLFGLWDYYSFVAPLQLALAKEDTKDSVMLLKSMLESALTPWSMKNSPLFRHIAEKANQGNTGKQMLPALLSELEHNIKYQFLHENTEFQELLRHYRTRCQTA